MNSLTKSFAAAAVATLLSVGTSAHAGVIIDLFDGGISQSVSTGTVGAGGTAWNQVGPGVSGVLGGYRDMSITKLSDQVAPAGSPTTFIAEGGVLDLSNPTGNTSLGVVTWDGANNAGAQGLNVSTTGLGGVDLTADGATALLANIIAADLGFDYKIRVWDMFGNTSTLSASVQVPIVPAYDASADYLFSWFNLANGAQNEGGLDFTISRTGIVDFTKIGALQLELTNASAISVDLAIGQVRAVPEPGVLALLGAGLLGAAVAGRRRKA